MEFRGFRSIGEYESECARFGYLTRRISFHDQRGNSYFALVTAPPNKTSSSIEAWTLFTADESTEVLDGVINGVDKNWLGKLAKHGFFPDEPQDAHGCYWSSPACVDTSIEEICFVDITGQLCLRV